MENFRNTKTKYIILALLLSTGALGVLTGVFGSMYSISDSDYVSLSEDYQELYDKYNQLLNDYQILTGDYNDSLVEYDLLELDYEELLDAYEKLEFAYNYTVNTIKQTILPVQYCIFAEAVRRYYLPLYLDNTTTKDWYMGYTEFCRDMILHDSGQYNSFSVVSDAFSDALKYGNDTMNLAFHVMYEEFWPWLYHWDGWDLTGNELTDINTIVNWSITEIDYEFDSIITYNQESPTWDYPKFPVETAFRTFGDCEDQAILCASYLESCGFETTISIIHDPDHPTLEAFYHGVCLVHIEDTSAFYSTYPSCTLWRLSTIDPFYPEYTWCWLDSTWDVPFGSEPLWLQAYGGSLSWDILSIAFCDIDGAIA